MPTPIQLDKYFDTAIPKSYGFEWDVGGISLLANNNNTDKIVIALDVSVGALDYAAQIGAGIVVTHHPAVFNKIDSIRCDDGVGMRLLTAAKHGISLLAYHTRLDNAPGGVNDILCSLAGLNDCFEFTPCARLGRLQTPCDIRELADGLGRKLINNRVQIYKNNDKPVSKVAVCSGSGGDIIRDAYLSGADTLLTGEIKHNYLVDAKDYGVNVIAAGHYETEVLVLPALREIILKEYPCAEVFEYYG